MAPSSPFAVHLAREAELLAKLRHENILELYDFVSTDAAMWLVLEYVDGVSLAEVLAQCERLSTAAAVAIGLELARALAHAHERGIVHRDVKPSNVLISRSGSIKLVDFGIAHDDHVPSSPEPLDAGATFGTPAYMAPEQILGEPVDARADIFSLGVLLYQLLSGTRPFDGPDTRTTAQRIRHAEPRSLVSAVPEVPRTVERVVMRCMEKLPGDRFSGARELVSALETVLRAETARSTEELVLVELARAKIVADLPPSSPSLRPSEIPEPARATFGPAARGFGVLLVLAVAGGAVIQQKARRMEEAESGRQGILELVPARAGFLRVVARPWARVVVDGQVVEVTPFARSIPLAAGTHYVTLKHPVAGDERRVVKLTPGQTVTLDVTMGLPEDAARDAGADGGAFIDLESPEGDRGP
jgi:serine/threonine-protein kinase